MVCMHVCHLNIAVIGKKMAITSSQCLQVFSGVQNRLTIRKTYLYSFDPLKPHFYILKLGFRGVYIIFLISAQKHRLWVLVRTSTTSTHNLCFEQKYEQYQTEKFYLKNFQFLVVKFSIYLNRHVFVMIQRKCTEIKQQRRIIWGK